MFLAKMLQRPMSVFNYDDGRVNHRADGYCDPSESHDIRGQAEPRHRVVTEPDGEIAEDSIVTATGSYGAAAPLGARSGPGAIPTTTTNASTHSDANPFPDSFQ